MKSSAPRLTRLETNFYSALGARIATLEAAGRRVIRLDVGSPDLPPAEHILAALHSSAASPHTHGYQEHNDVLRLKDAWGSLYRNAFSLTLDPEKHILPLIGSKEGIFHLPLAWIEPGDVCLIPDPGYPTYTQGTLIAGGEPFFLPLLPERNFLPDLTIIPSGILNRARILWLNYPNNPTGATAPMEFFREAVELANRHGLLVCHDAAYHQVTFDGYRAPSILQIPGAIDTAVEFNTFSKSYNMAGWRLGAAVGNPAALQALGALKSQMDSGHFRPVIEAAIAAVEGDQDWLLERNLVYEQRRDLAASGLNNMGIPVQLPLASLYLWCPVPTGWASSFEFTQAALEGAGISLTPGTVFGAGGEGWFRISISVSSSEIEEALNKLERWLACL
jgi:LL-diaminopimelate aminotransferase